MIVKGTFKFPEQWEDVEFVNPVLEIHPIIKNANPFTMTIDVDIKFMVEGVTGGFSPDINPVPVNDLNYDTSKPQELVNRVLTRLNDFKV